MKYFHEAPNAIFNRVQELTDGDYALVHLLEENEKYRELFFEARKAGREIILDNSIFELGEAFDSVKYADWIERLQPSWYIIPDVFNDAEATLDSLSDWNKQFSDLPGMKIGVLQGKSQLDMMRALSRMSKNVDMIAIPFHAKFFENGPGFGIDDRLMRGRQRLLAYLNNYLQDINKPVHLLGCALPQEGIAYYNNDFIYSIDTSSPVVHGMKQTVYTDAGLSGKIKTKLHTMIDSEVSDNAWDYIEYNINKFKGFWE